MRKNRIVSILMSMLMIIAGSYTSIFADSVSLTKLDKPTVTRLQCSTVYWNPVENADTYDVYIEVWRGDKGVGGEAAVDLTDTSFYIYDYCVELMSDAGYTSSDDLFFIISITAYSNNKQQYASSNPSNMGVKLSSLRPHSFSEWSTVKAATEVTSGLQKRTCSNCGELETKVIPQLAPSLSAVKLKKPTAGKKSAVVKWKKLSAKALKKAKKIEVQYSLDKSFKKGVITKYANAKKSSLKIKKLKKGKKYYVRIRAFTKAGSATHVSKWTAVKSVKAK